MIALAVREMRMTPAEALWAATAGGAAALRRDDVGAAARRGPGRPHGARRAVLPAPGLPPGRADRRVHVSLITGRDSGEGFGEGYG